MFGNAVLESLFGNNSSDDVKIGIYGNRRAGKTTFLYHIFKKWKDDGRVVQSNDQFQELIRNYESDLAHNKEVHRTVVDQFDIRVGIKSANGIGIQRFVFSDIRGENAAKDIDGIHQNIVPDRVRRIAEKCDIFIFMFNPTYWDADENGFHEHELARMLKVIDVLVVERKESLPRICYVQTHNDIVSVKPSFGSISQQVRESFVMQASSKIRNGLNLNKIHPNFFPLESKCYCVNSLPCNKDIETSPQAVLDKVVELKAFVPKGPQLPFYLGILFLTLILAIVMVVLIALYNRDPKWVRDLKAGRFSMEYLPEFRKYVDDHQTSGWSDELWSGLHSWLNNNPASRAKVVQAFKDDQYNNENINRIKIQIDDALLARFQKSIKVNHEKRENHDQLVSSFNDIMRSEDGIIMMESKSKALDQAKKVCEYLDKTKENGCEVGVTIRSRESNHYVVDGNWYFMIGNNQRKPCTFPLGKIQKVYLEMNNDEKLNFCYSYKGNLALHNINLEVKKNGLGLPSYIKTNVPVSVSSFDEIIQLGVIGLPDLIIKEYYNNQVENNPPLPILNKKARAEQPQKTEPLPPPPKKQPEYIDAELCWEESWWFLSTTKCKRNIKFAKLHSDCFLCVPDAFSVPPGGIRPYLVIDEYWYSLDRIKIANFQNESVFCLDFDPSIRVLDDYDLAVIGRELEISK